MSAKLWRATGSLVLGAALAVTLGGPASAQDRGVELPLGETGATGRHDGSLEESVGSGWNLGRGAEGEAVAELQRKLQDLGEEIEVTSRFDAETEAALNRIKRALGLPENGFADEDTVKAMIAKIVAELEAAMAELGEEVGEASAAAGAGGGAASAGARGVLSAELNGGQVDAPQPSALEDAINGGETFRDGDTGPEVEELQRRLNEAGYSAPSSGTFDSGTRDAVRNLQRDQGASRDGIVGPETLGALTSAEAGGDAPAAGSGNSAEWMRIARSQVGVREVPGRGNNRRIQDYHVAGGLGRAADSTPWCSSFVNWVMREAGLPRTGRANARSWLSYGQRLSQPVPGCIVIFWRGSRNGSLGHVGFYAGEEGGRMLILGGNQGDAVSIIRKTRSQVLGYRWPAGVPLPR